MNSFRRTAFQVFLKATAPAALSAALALLAPVPIIVGSSTVALADSPAAAAGNLPALPNAPTTDDAKKAFAEAHLQSPKPIEQAWSIAYLLELSQRLNPLLHLIDYADDLARCVKSTDAGVRAMALKAYFAEKALPGRYDVFSNAFQNEKDLNTRILSIQAIEKLALDEHNSSAIEFLKGAIALPSVAGPGNSQLRGYILDFIEQNLDPSLESSVITELKADVDPSNSVQSVRILTKLATPTAKAALSDLFKSCKLPPDAMFATMVALGKLKDDSSFDTILRIAKPTTDDFDQIPALDKYRNQTADFMSTTLDLQLAAILSLGYYQDPRAIPVLQPIAAGRYLIWNTPYSNIQEIAITSLVILGTPESVSAAASQPRDWLHGDTVPMLAKALVAYLPRDSKLIADDILAWIKDSLFRTDVYNDQVAYTKALVNFGGYAYFDTLTYFGLGEKPSTDPNDAASFQRNRYLIAAQKVLADKNLLDADGLLKLGEGVLYTADYILHDYPTDNDSLGWGTKNVRYLLLQYRLALQALKTDQYPGHLLMSPETSTQVDTEIAAVNAKLAPLSGTDADDAAHLIPIN